MVVRLHGLQQYNPKYQIAPNVGGIPKIKLSVEFMESAFYKDMCLEVKQKHCVKLLVFQWHMPMGKFM